MTKTVTQRQSPSYCLTLLLQKYLILLLVAVVVATTLLSESQFVLAANNVNESCNSNNNNNNNNNINNNFSGKHRAAFISSNNKSNEKSPRGISSTTTTTTTTGTTTTSTSSSLSYANTPDENEEKKDLTQNNNNNNNIKSNNKKDNIMRAWNCHGRNQRDLVDRMIQANIVRTDSVRDVLYQVDRQYYAPQPSNSGQQNSNSINPYIDAPQPIGLGQTISAPHMHAHVLEEIYPFLKASTSNQIKILDVGCGSGYLTAALGRWVAPLQSSSSSSSSGGGSAGGSLLDQNKTGLVYGIDIYPHLVEKTKQNMEKQDQDLLSNKIVTLQVTNGWKGLPDAAPFDAIHVGAAAAEFPRALLEQLKVNGVLIIPVGPERGVQNLYRVERLGDGFTQEDFRITELLGVRYVPLVQQQQQDTEIRN